MTDVSAENKVLSVLLCGVGGQGTILAADLLAHTALAAGCETKLSEVHGMAQRGGAVTTVVRFGAQVSSMVSDFGSADHILAFETTEALRNCAYKKEKGTMFVNDESVKPLPVLTGKAAMPADASKRLLEMGAHLIPAGQIALAAGSAKATNVVLLGALSTVLHFDQEIWEDQIKKRVPTRFVDLNLAAFRAGLAYLNPACD